MQSTIRQLIESRVSEDAPVQQQAKNLRRKTQSAGQNLDDQKVRRLNQEAYFCQFGSVQIRIEFGSWKVRRLNRALFSQIFACALNELCFRARCLTLGFIANYLIHSPHQKWWEMNLFFIVGDLSIAQNEIVHLLCRTERKQTMH